MVETRTKKYPSQNNTSKQQNNTLTCDDAKHNFAQEIHSRHPEIENSDIIKKWINSGEKHDHISKLLDKPDDTSHNPIWWSGFLVEDDTDNADPVDMKDAAKAIGGYLNLTTKLGQFRDLQNIMWSACYEDDKFKYGHHLSTTYTEKALKHNPKNLFLFVNKPDEQFTKSYFYTVELPIIKNYINANKHNITLYVFNKFIEHNCNDISNLISFDEDTKNNLKKLVCIHGKNMMECANKYTKYNHNELGNIKEKFVTIGEKVNSTGGGLKKRKRKTSSRRHKKNSNKRHYKSKKSKSKRKTNNKSKRKSKR